MWLKYRRGTSSSAGTWQYKFLGNNQPNGVMWWVKSFIEELNHEYAWSEHHRGYEYCLVWFPPEDVLKRILQDEEDKLTRISKTVKTLREQLKTLKS